MEGWKDIKRGDEGLLGEKRAAKGTLHSSVNRWEE